jgi:hypothetical protein
MELQSEQKKIGCTENWKREKSKAEERKRWG